MIISCQPDDADGQISLVKEPGGAGDGAAQDHGDKPHGSPSGSGQSISAGPVAGITRRGVRQNLGGTERGGEQAVSF